MICVTTRFHFKNLWNIIPIFWAYKCLQQDLKTAPGLIRHAFLFQNPMVCCTISIWESEQAMANFSNVSHHVNAVRTAKRFCLNIWSAYWHIDAISKYATQWPDEKAWPALTPHTLHPHRLVPLKDQS